MGFKAACLFVNTKQPGYFGTSQNLMPSRVPRVCGMLGISKAKRIGKSDFLNAFYPPKDQFALGVYEGGIVYASQDLFNDNPREFFDKVKNKVLVDYPKSQTLTFEVYSTVNLFGYALYQDGVLERAYGGNGDDDVTLDIGELQPEEKPHFARSEVINGKRVFENPIMPLWKFNAPAYGETLVFAMTERFLGTPLDHAMPHPLEIELFQKT